MVDKAVLHSNKHFNFKIKKKDMIYVSRNQKFYLVEGFFNLCQFL